MSIARYRFVILLVALALFLFVTPVAREMASTPESIGSHLVATSFFVALLLTAVFAASRTRFAAMVAMALAVPTVILDSVNVAIQHDMVDIAGHAVGITFLWYIVFVILRFLFRADRVTSDTICAALCVYLLIGVVWSMEYSLLQMLDPQSFNFPAAEDVLGEGSLRFGSTKSVHAIYFSFVTLTTLGYGDIVPASSFARMLASSEAVVGQLFLAVLVARLVGMHIIHSKDNRDVINDSHE